MTGMQAKSRTLEGSLREAALALIESLSANLATLMVGSAHEMDMGDRLFAISAGAEQANALARIVSADAIADAIDRQTAAIAAQTEAVFGRPAPQ